MKSKIQEDMRKLQIKDGVVIGSDEKQAFTKDNLTYMVSLFNHLIISFLEWLW